MPKEVVREVIKEVVREVPVEVPVEVCAHRLKMKTVPSASGLLRTAHKPLFNDTVVSSLAAAAGDQGGAR